MKHNETGNLLTMSLLNRATLIQFHMLLAAFIFPAALMFLITGGFYTWGVKGSYDTQVHSIALGDPLTNDRSALVSLVQNELARLGIAEPSGAAKIKTAGTSYLLEWTGAERDVILEPMADETAAKLTIKETSWYRHFVQLHKAKAGTPFKVYAAIFATSLLVILLSGFVMAFQIPKYRARAAVCAAAGFTLFFLIVNAS